MRNPLESLIKRLGSMYSIERDNGSVDPVKGLINQEQSTGKRYIGFLPGTDIQVDDWLTNPSGDRFYVIDKETATFQGKPHELRCFIETEAEHPKKGMHKAFYIWFSGVPAARFPCFYAGLRCPGSVFLGLIPL